MKKIDTLKTINAFSFGGLRGSVLKITLLLFALYAPIMYATAQEGTQLVWDIDFANEHVSRVGTSENVLKLGNLGFDLVNPPALGATLDIAYAIDKKAGSTRYIHAWTDLCGTPEEVEEFDFVKLENRTAGKVVRTQPNLVATDISASITIPQNFLYDAVTEKYASVIYVSITTFTGDDAVHVETNQRGWGNESQRDFLKLGTIELLIKEPVQFTSHITLTPGETADKINFAWFTKAGTATEAKLQLNPGTAEMQEFTGVNATGVHGFSTNKVTITELTPNTTYTYRVGDGTEEHWSKIYSFKTYDPNIKYSIIAIADPQIGSSGDRGQWAETVPAAIAQAEKAGNGPVFMLSAGDQIDYANDIDELNSYLSPSALKTIPVAVTIGNHDAIDLRVGPEQTAFMDKVYNFPNHDDLQSTTADKTRIRAGGDYYFHYGNTLYISINSQVSEAAIHENFMKEAIASYPDATWKIALFHHNIYGGGAHASPKGYADSYNMQATWSPFLDKYGIDLAINGHDHVYARSHFMQGNQIMKYQMPTVLDVNEIGSTNATFVQPQGIQYMALSGSTAKFYALENQPWVAYGYPQDNKAQYSIVSIDGESLTFSTYQTEDNAFIDGVTLKKTANLTDLQSLISGCETVVKNGITDESWNEFQTKIAEAKVMTDKDNAHTMYIALYEAFYALDPNTDKTELGSLIEVATEKLAAASEGRWKGQYAFGSKAQVQAVLDAAITVNDVRLATQEEINTAFTELNDTYTWFLSTESQLDVPFIPIHEIKAATPYTIDLVDWMSDGKIFFFGEDDKEHYNTHFTKQVYAKDIAEAMRSDDRFGPANAEGGRGHNQAHITTTHIGEWIRYELNVEQEGAYKATLGAANNTSVEQTVVLRDSLQNILSIFTIPANTPLVDNNWSNAGSIAGDKEFYLPAGKYVIELFFVNDGKGVDGSATENKYPAGPDVDILILERTGNMAAPVVMNDPTIFPLPFIPTTTGGAVNRQRGWSTTGSTWIGASSNMVGKDLPIAILKSATHLIMELAGPPSTSATRTIQANIMTESIDWSQAEPLLNGQNGVFKPTIGPFGALEFDLAKLTFTDGPDAYKRLQTMTSRGRILVGYYSYGWEELNLMKAYLRITPPLSIVPNPQTDTIHAWVNDGLLYVTGVTVGELLSIYSINGALVHSNIVASEQVTIPLQTQGVYIVRAGASTARVVACQQ
ncbi:MAG: metallophosphoesterase [Bacteroidales bacterium]|jgi:hypothetical protein|nr:metallophosphoesterase [Bacteroidales bacterium]